MENPTRIEATAASAPPASSCPPARMPLFRAGRMLKRWRYVGLYGPEIMLCAGSARVGPTWQVWWAVWDRLARRLDERTRQLVGRRRVEAERAGRLHVDDGDVSIDLELDEGPGVETVTPAGRTYIWTRKQGGIRARGRVRVGARRWEVDGPAFVDESAGYHDRTRRGAGPPGWEPRPTGVRWRGTSPRGSTTRRATASAPCGSTASRRSRGPCTSPSISRASRWPGAASFTAPPRRPARRDDNLLVLRSRYEQPFGTFSGALPGGLELAEGYGVMERHEVRW